MKSGQGDFKHLCLFAVAALLMLIYAGGAHMFSGHQADFGRQWLAGKLIVSGEGERLYDPVAQERVFRTQFGDDIVEKLRLEGVGWITYPPTGALVYAPLALFAPAVAQWMMVQISLLMSFIAACALRRSSHAEISLRLTIIALMIQPAFLYNIGLGQNACVSLAIIAGGWALWKEQRYKSAGFVWGLLAYKPTWAIAVAWAPLALGGPIAYLGMVASGCAMLLLTLPICGVDGWLEWLAVARQVDVGYSVVEKWTWMRKDLIGLVSHLFGEISRPAGWMITLSVMVTSTVLLHIGRRKSQVRAGWLDVLLFSGIVLACPKFMYYDLLLATPAFLLAGAMWAEMSRYSRVVFCMLIVAYYLSAVFGRGDWPMSWPLETMAVLGLWLLSAVHVVRQKCAQEPVPCES